MKKIPKFFLPIAVLTTSATAFADQGDIRSNITYGDKQNAKLVAMYQPHISKYNLI